MDLARFLILALAQVQSPFVVQEPDFGLDPCYPANGYAYSGRSENGRYLLRSGKHSFDPTYTILGIPYSVDTWTGVVTRLDLTQEGAIPDPGGGNFDSAVVATSRDTRFVVFLSASTSYADHPKQGGHFGMYWVDRDSDGDSIFDELDGRRIVCVLATPDLEGIGIVSGGLVDISDDGRHLVFEEYGASPHHPRIWVADLDADHDGILAEANQITKYPISGLQDDGNFETPSAAATISGDGRYVSFEKWAEPDWVSIRVYAGYTWVYNYPPGYPFTRRPMLFDRDSDEDGIFDEPGATELRDLGPYVGYSHYWNTTAPTVSASGRELLSIVTRSENPPWEVPYGRTLVAFDIRKHTTNSLVPSVAYGDDSYPVSFSVDHDARRIVTTTVSSRTPSATNPAIDFSIVSIERDTDDDAIFDEPDSSRARTLTFPNDQEPWGPILDPSGRYLRVFLGATPEDPYDPLFVYGASHVDFDCSASAFIEAAMCPIDWPKQLRLHLFGCPQPGETVLVELGAAPTAAPIVFLFAGTGTPAPVASCSLAMATIDFSFAVPFPVAQYGSNRRATLPIKLPAQLPPIEFDLRAVTVHAATNAPWLSSRIHVATP